MEIVTRRAACVVIINIQFVFDFDNICGIEIKQSHIFLLRIPCHINVGVNIPSFQHQT